MRFAGDLCENVAKGDANYLSLLDEADAYVSRFGLDLPEEPEARRLPPDPDCMTDPLRTLDLGAEGVSTILGCLARCRARGRPDRHSARLRRLRPRLMPERLP